MLSQVVWQLVLNSTFAITMLYHATDISNTLFKGRRQIANNTNNIYNALFNLLFVETTSMTRWRFHRKGLSSQPLAKY